MQVEQPHIHEVAATEPFAMAQGIPGNSDASRKASSLSWKFCRRILDIEEDALVNPNQAHVRKPLVDKGFRDTTCQNPWWERLSADR